jgi:hypothetical protein
MRVLSNRGTEMPLGQSRAIMARSVAYAALLCLSTAQHALPALRPQSPRDYGLVQATASLTNLTRIDERLARSRATDR